MSIGHKPVKPIEPTKFIKQKRILKDLYDNDYQLSSLIEIARQTDNPDDVILRICVEEDMDGGKYNISCLFIDELVENKNYDKAMILYNKALEKYKERLVKWEAKKATDKDKRIKQLEKELTKLKKEKV